MELTRNNRALLAIGAIIIAVSGVIWYLQTPLQAEGDYGDVTVEQAMALIRETPSLVILDVRTPAEYGEGHLERAINIPVDELVDRLDELSRDDELLVYCRTGNRSRRAVDALLEDGFTRVYHMVDGIEGWKRAGYPVIQ
ncbi:MAG: rhodanese-like domain-containing protein [Candidatus Bathyarchaeota archaeon]|nr:MAG: rhodanese-like domain-containing protein [Candidatus Bathyarchaeota archaeon]